MPAKKPQPEVEPDTTDTPAEPEVQDVEVAQETAPAEVQDVDDAPDSGEVQDAPEVDEAPSLAEQFPGATHLNPQGYPVTLAASLHGYHQARGYTRIPPDETD